MSFTSSRLRRSHLSEPSQRKVLLALYWGRLDYRRASSNLGVTAEELNGLHPAAPAALAERLTPAVLQMPNQDATLPKP